MKVLAFLAGVVLTVAALSVGEAAQLIKPGVDPDVDAWPGQSGSNSNRCAV